MLTLLAFGMVATFMTLIMTRRLSVLPALVLVPAVFGLLAGHGAGLGAMMLDGIRDLAPTGVMLIFAILYFGLMIEAGLFEPLVRRVVAAVRGDPVRVLVGTAVLALVVSLDGDGATTYMITVGALLPVYRGMRLDVRWLACVIMLAAAVTNLLPWGGPTSRAAAALGLDPAVVFRPLLPAMAITAGWVLLVAWILGRRERQRLAATGAGGVLALPEEPAAAPVAAGEDVPRAAAPFWFNALLTAALLVLLVAHVMPLPVLFMMAFALALAVNYPSLAAQRACLARHAPNALAVGGVVFAAGVLVGVLTGTGMVDAMARSVLEVIPPGLAAQLVPVTALVSIPFTYLISNDAFYFGMLPVIAQAAALQGLDPAELARASLVGQQLHLLSPLVPSTYLLVGLCGIDFAEHQRTTLPWALGSCLVMFVACLLTGAFALG